MANGTNDTTNQPNSAKRPVGKPVRSSGAEHAAEQAAVRNPDAVQKGIIDVWGWVEDNAKLLAGLLLLLIIAGIAHVIMHSYWDRQERKAQSDYFAAESKYTKIKESFDRAKFKALVPPTATKPESATDQAATGDLQKDFGSVLPDLEKVARDHKGTTAGAQAAILLAGTYLDYKQADRALEFAELPSRELGKKHLLAQLSQMLLGGAQAVKGDCGAAVKTWQDVLDNKNANALHGEAALRSGLCFETMNQPEKAMEMYRKVSADDPQSAAANTAKGLLRALEIKSVKSPQAPQKG